MPAAQEIACHFLQNHTKGGLTHASSDFHFMATAELLISHEINVNILQFLLLPFTCESQSGPENQMIREISSHCDKNSAHNVGGKYRLIPLMDVLSYFANWGAVS